MEFYAATSKDGIMPFAQRKDEVEDHANRNMTVQKDRYHRFQCNVELHWKMDMYVHTPFAMLIYMHMYVCVGGCARV